MECPICFNVIKYSSVGSCTHHYCTMCLIDWCMHGGISCPKCKTFISEIKPDKEFDSINTSIINYDINYNINMDISQNYKTVIVYFKQRDSAGITLKNNYKNYNRAPGVKIFKIDKKNTCYESGLRINDIIININNIPCINHKQAIDIVNYCVLSGKQMICHLLSSNDK